MRGAGADTIVMVEHPAVVTLGRHAPVGDVLVDRAALERREVALVTSDRGGRATYHGPGQAVVYPIVSLTARGLGVKAWVCILEKALLATLNAYGLSGACSEGRPGVWIGDASAFPTASGVNPMLTIMALARRTAEAIAAS